VSALVVALLHCIATTHAGELGQLQSEAAGNGVTRRAAMLTSLAAPGTARGAHGAPLQLPIPCTNLLATQNEQGTVHGAADAHALQTTIVGEWLQERPAGRTWKPTSRRRWRCSPLPTTAGGCSHMHAICQVGY
jgi:hypothetical protein